MERLYTIPVNEAFDLGLEDGQCSCPFCMLKKKLEDNEIELILGASMMEPDIRTKTNKEGFCGKHYDLMFHRKNRLGLALMMESHLAEVKKDLKGGIFGAKADGVLKKLTELEKTCYICTRVDFHFGHMIETAVLLYSDEAEFRKKYQKQPYFCLPHARRLLGYAQKKLNKKGFSAIYEDTMTVLYGYYDSLSEDVSRFCRHFDYRYQDEPLGTAKNSVERTITFLSGEDEA